MTSSVTINARIHAAMDKLSPSERRVAKVLLASYPIAGLETVAQLAARAQVSGATVVRFVRQLGFEGYPAFHQNLREEVQRSAASPLQRYAAQGIPSGADLLGQTRHCFEHGVNQTLTRLSKVDIDEAVDLLVDTRKRIWCTGGRFSGVMADYLYRYLSQIRAQTYLLAAGPERSDRLIDIGKHDVVVAFDFRRYQADTVRFAQACRARGASVLLITDPDLSPIAEVAKHVLTCDMEGLSLYASFLPTVALIEVLIAALVARLGEAALQRLTALEQMRDETGAG